MTRYARTAKAEWSEVHPIERPFSNFDFLERHFGNDTSLTLPRLMSQVRHHGGRTMVVEKLLLSADLLEEVEDLKMILAQPFEYQVYRLCFFTKKFKRKTSIQSVTDQEFIGYAIVVNRIDNPAAKKPSNFVHVYESVIKRSCHAHNFVRGEQEWVCSIIGRRFKVSGYLYAEQNAHTNVCAHTALRTVSARFLPDGLSYRQISKLANVSLNEAADGLSSDQIVKVLEKRGARCIVADFTKRKRPPAPFHKYIYGSIESGYPVIVFFGTTTSSSSYHVIPVFGHTFNQDTWVPNADRSYFRIGKGTRYVPSDSWLSMFVGHDDQLGSNLCIPRHYLQTKQHPAPSDGAVVKKLQKMVDSIAYVIATIPKRVKLSPIRAEVIGADYLRAILNQLPNVQSDKWADRLLRFARGHQLVLRPLLITGKEYAAHLERVKNWKGKPINRQKIGAIRNWLGDTPLWMIELSVPELFSANKRKVGEVLLLAARKVGARRDMKSFVLARLPGRFALYQGGGPSRPKFIFVSSGASGHVELFGCEDMKKQRRETKQNG